MNLPDALGALFGPETAAGAAALVSVHVHLWLSARRTRAEVKELEHRIEALEARAR